MQKITLKIHKNNFQNQELLKISYIILVYLKMAGFWISNVENIPLCLKNTLQKWKTSVFGKTQHHQTFTEEFISNQYTHFGILTRQIWLQVMECPLIFK